MRDVAAQAGAGAAREAAHTEAEIHQFLRQSKEAVIATSGGEDIRLRMMHLGFEDDFGIYLASMRNDPKVVQITHHPSVSVLVYRAADDPAEAAEVEYVGRARLLRDPAQRERCVRATSRTSPVVQALLARGETGVLDCIRIEPRSVKYRRFGEIVRGVPPTVIEFPGTTEAGDDWAELKRRLSALWLALRPNSLAASGVAALLGAALAYARTGAWLPGAFLLTLAGALAAQAATNVFNDYGDHRNGNDAANRAFVRPFGGGSRVIQSGLLTPAEALGGGIALSLAAAAIGAVLALQGRPWVLPMGLAGLAAGILYSRPGWTLIRAGLGELSVALCFGPLIGLGAYYVQAGRVGAGAAAALLPLALLIGAVLLMNEFQDDDADRRTGKPTLVVRLGRRRALSLYEWGVASAYGLLPALVALGTLPVPALLALATAPLAWRAARTARRHLDDNVDLAPANGLTVLTHLSFGLLQAVGCVAAVAPAAAAALGLASLAFAVYMYRYIERLRLAGAGVRAVVLR